MMQSNSANSNTAVVNKKLEIKQQQQEDHEKFSQDWSNEFPWSKEMKETMNNMFGVNDYRLIIYIT